MSTKLPINLNDLLRQRTIEGERLPQRLLAQTFGQPGASA